MCLNYTRTQPCNDCPYRKDAPLKLWSVEEFNDLMVNDSSYLGSSYGCHKKDGHVCVGFLMDQDNRNFPSIMLRMSLSKAKVTREYLYKLFCKSPMFSSIKEMCKANFPRFFTGKKIEELTAERSVATNDDISTKPITKN